MRKAHPGHAPDAEAIGATVVLNGGHADQGFRIDRVFPISVQKSGDTTHNRA